MKTATKNLRKRKRLHISVEPLYALLIFMSWKEDGHVAASIREGRCRHPENAGI
jgi:hypothetical protein